MTNLKQRTWNPTIALDVPLRWRKPYLVTLDVDLFDGMSDERIAAVFGVMAACPSSVFCVWTAHPKRAREWFESTANNNRVFDWVLEHPSIAGNYPNDHRWEWPLPKAWLGIIAHTQAELDERAPDILACPAAMHWLRLVLHGRIDARAYLGACEKDCEPDSPCGGGRCSHPSFGHIEVSGAIGKDASPCDVEWIREVIMQGRDAGVPVYVRALGSRPRHTPEVWEAPCRIDSVHARNGDRPGEWPADLRVREWPKGVEVNE